MNSKDIRQFIKSDLKNVKISVTDTDYAQPTKEWVQKKLFTNFNKWLWKNGLDEWKTYKDCDNYAFALRVFASMCHASTMRIYEKMGRDTIQGISIGVMFYKINGERGRGHAINFMVQKDGSMLYIEPQTGEWLNLNQREKDTTWFAVI